MQPMPMLLGLVGLTVLPLRTEPPQIDWQRSLDDALAIAEAEGRKLLIAINADGESASERIVRERYRAPEFVAWTEPFVCVVGSVFRHNPRDFDAEGRRIPCPRLGRITCGEHIAMEPRVFERFQAGVEILLDGEVVERISPRHTVAAPDGTVDWDLFLLFDLRELDDALRASAEAAAPGATWAPHVRRPFAEGQRPTQAQLRLAAADPRNRSRSVFEDILDHAGPRRWDMTNAVLYGALRGSPGAVDALRILSKWQLPRGRLAYAARVLGVEAETLAAIRERVESRHTLLRRALVTARPESPRWLLEILAQLDPDGELGSRTLRLSHSVMPDERLHELLHAARDTRSEVLTPVPPDERPSAVEYENLLESLEAQLEARPDDAALQLELGRALLGLARRRIEVGDGSAGFLLEDAARELGRAAQRAPQDVALQLDLARTAYYRSNFEAQERHALNVLALPGLDLDTRTEAQRWLGDAGARLLAQRAAGDEQEERDALLRTFEALSAAALSAESDATDWVSWASFCGASGRPYAQWKVASEGLARHPESNELRGVFTGAQRWLGAPARLRGAYEDLAHENPESGACAWYAGWAGVNDAEWLRRGEQPDQALERYDAAAEFFRRAQALEPSYADTCEHYLSMCALGRGFAHLLAGRRDAAVEALLEAVELRPQVATQRDGLNREPLDLIDGALEWNWNGESPVDPVALADALAAADPQDPFWPRAVADAELREGLRAYGRSEPEAGMAHLRRSLEIAPRALALVDDEENRALVAQSATVVAEALLDADAELVEVRALLARAAELQGLTAPADEAPREALEALRGELRELLGPARPAFRPGR